MASTSGRKTTTSSGRRTTSNNNRKTQTNRGRSTNSRVQSQEEKLISNEVLLICSFFVLVLLFLCNFGIIGPVGDAISNMLFGILGILSYIFPICLFLWIAFGISNKENIRAMMKLVASIVVFLCINMAAELFTGNLASMEQLDIKTFYEYSSQNHNGGGVLAGILVYGLYSLLDIVGTVLVILVLLVICFVIITGKSVVKGVKENSKKVYSSAKEETLYRNEQARIKREEARFRRMEEQAQKIGEENAKEAEKIRRMNKKVSGVMLDTTLKENKQTMERDDIHEITLKDIKNRPSDIRDESSQYDLSDMDHIRIHTSATPRTENLVAETAVPETIDSDFEEVIAPVSSTKSLRPKATLNKENVGKNENEIAVSKEIAKSNKTSNKKYVFPSVNLLKKPEGGNKGTSANQLKETAMHLQQTLKTFGVNVTVTDISQGPSVTRYELQPEPGVKVSRIVNLADDIKLNLAAADIRIEAPIPGKSAVGIEVPNKENSAVVFRELIESREFKEFDSRITFAVGKDISGHVVVSDIAKMPHMLIAGSTGSGKSVCINTIIMSILYKAHPDDVKLIMVDPKVVELSVYNGIPHLMIPVVTDPKKAAAALNWAVAEMSDRYRRFAEFNVRDLKGYNKQVEAMLASGKEDVPAKMPQLVIIVDELADLMMVAAHEVEESICRLAQLARAAGIHLIIATQRPSVDVITGLIKANMPSRVAFAVSSGVDSRTILDMNGAEKLLGKGDMLYYPQGYTKPARIQGAFISDGEVSDVVDFLKNQAIGNTYNEEIEEKIKNIGSSSSNQAASDGDSDRDEYFERAGRYIIEKDKASIGMLQRVFKIGFNRAARIMDQLCEAGVVGEEEGTKPRKVLMSMEQFDAYIEEYV